MSEDTNIHEKVDNKNEIKLPINIFSYMMSNRHKQDEIINKIVEKEQDEILCIDSENEKSDSDCLNQAKTNRSSSSNCNGVILSSNALSHADVKKGKLNAFQFLMSNQSRNICGDKKSDSNYEASSDLHLNAKIKKKKPLQREVVNSVVYLSDGSSDREGSNSIPCKPDLNIEASKENGLKITDSTKELEANDLKLNLINENEYFDIEETFKEEILECVSKKKKRNKKKEILKKRRKRTSLHDGQNSCIENEEQNYENFGSKSHAKSTKILQKEKENLVINGSYMRDSAQPVGLANSIHHNSHQPNIKHFFKSLTCKKSKNKSINTILNKSPGSLKSDKKNNTNEPELLKINKLINKSVTADLSLSIDSSNSDPTCQQMKTKSIREIRTEKNSKLSINATLEKENDKYLIDSFDNVPFNSVKENLLDNKDFKSKIHKATEKDAHKVFSSSKSKNNKGKLFIAPLINSQNNNISFEMKGSENIFDNQEYNFSSTQELPKQSKEQILVAGSEYNEDKMLSDGSDIEVITPESNKINRKAMTPKSSYFEDKKESMPHVDLENKIESVPQSTNSESKQRRSSRSVKKINFFGIFLDSNNHSNKNKVEKSISVDSESENDFQTPKSVKKRRKNNKLSKKKASLELKKTRLKMLFMHQSSISSRNRKSHRHKKNSSDGKQTSSSPNKKVSSLTENSGIPNMSRSHLKKGSSRLSKETCVQPRGKSLHLKECSNETKNMSLHCSSPTESTGNPEIEILKIGSIPSKSDVKKNKIAPIFQKKKPPVAISPARLKARSDFLFSSCEPERKVNTKSEEPSFLCIFPKQSHVKQVEELEAFWHLPEPQISSLSEETPSSVPCCIRNLNWESKWSLKPKAKKNFDVPLTTFPFLSSETMCHILAYLKCKDESFPVMSIFSALKQSKGEHLKLYRRECLKEELKGGHKDSNLYKREHLKEELGGSHKDSKIRKDASSERESPGSKKCKRKKGKSLLSSKRRKIIKETDAEWEETDDVPIWHENLPYDWSQVFAPTSLEFVMGNSDAVQDLKTWLSEWRIPSKIDPNFQDDSFDTSCSDDCAMNAVLVTGPPGVGKTAAVYALARDFGYKVLEVNASSCRQGKQLMSQLSEATQSHSVSTGNSTPFFGANSVEVIDLEGQDHVENPKSMSLILIEDVDIVFEDADDGFLSAVNTLLSTSKRPIVMTSCYSNPSTLKIKEERFLHIRLVSPEPKLIAQHLQLLCLINGAYPSIKELELLVRRNKEDIRQTVADLQFWVLSGLCKVQWWKIDNANYLNKVLNLPENNDINIKKIFPWAPSISSKYIEIPIAHESIWSKDDVKLLQNLNMNLEDESLFNWTLLSANCPSILPFENKKQEKLACRYPIREDDPVMKATSQWKRYSWLSLDEDSDTEKELCDALIPATVGEAKTYSKTVERSFRTCIDSVSTFFNSFADFDVLSSGFDSDNERSVDTLRNKWWSAPVYLGLDSVRDGSLYCGYLSHLNTHVIPRISRAYLSRTNDQISPLLNSINEDESAPFTIDVTDDPLSFKLQPHCYLSQRQKLHQEDLDLALSAVLPLLSQLQRSAVVKDHLPYMREIARSDQLETAIQKFKRVASRRFLKHFRQLGFAIDACKLIDVCNVFQC